MKVIAVDSSFMPINELTWEAATKAIAMGRASALDLVTWKPTIEENPKVVVYPGFLTNRKPDLNLLRRFYELIAKS